MGSNPSTIYWMDIISHIFAVRIIMFVRKDENKRKIGREWPNFMKKKLPTNLGIRGKNNLVSFNLPSMQHRRRTLAKMSTV